MFYSSFGTQVIADKAYIAFAHGSNNNFQTYYFSADLCITRTSSVCGTCPAGYYRDSLLANNLCILPAQFLPANGPDNSSWLMRPCTTANCGACTVTFSTCTACAATYYLYAGSCYLPASLPAGIGANTGNGQSQTCSTAGCVNCQTTYLTCTVCDSGKYLFSGSCYLPASLPTGVGANTMSGIGQVCQTASCDNCKTNYQTCSVCQSGLYLIANTCYTATTIPTGYGVNTAVTDQALACTSAGCVDCKTNYQTCV